MSTEPALTRGGLLAVKVLVRTNFSKKQLNYNLKPKEASHDAAAKNRNPVVTGSLFPKPAPALTRAGDLKR